jgi:4-hydroxy-2-oxoheptanedioate aldolase
MVETPSGVDDVEGILAVPGVDAVFIGPSDLALSFGVGRDETANADRIAGIKSACDARAIPAGIATTSADEAKRFAAAGFEMIALPSDAVILAQSCAALLSSVREDNCSQ